MITASTMSAAMTIAGKFVPDCDYDVEASKNAGYPIYRSTSNYYDYICYLGDRLEVNLGGKSFNIWVVKKEAKADNTALATLLEMCDKDNFEVKDGKLILSFK